MGIPVEEPDPMTLNRLEIFLSLKAGGGTESLVVLNRIIPKSVFSYPVLCPPLILRNCEKCELLISLVFFLGYLDDGCDEFFEELFVAHYEIWPKEVDEVNQEALDVRPIVVLICHYHNRAVPKGLQVLTGDVLLAHLQSHDLHQILNLVIVAN